MHTPLFASTYLSINAPWWIPWHFLGLELAVIAGGVLAFVHALRAYRAGDGASLFAWTTIFVYGLLMEIISYNTVNNFHHGIFSVMLYHDRLPLYISTIYPVFIYSSLKIVQRFGLSRAAEPFAVGLTIVLLDMPFDILGPGAGWWTWSDSDPVLAFRWYGVPVTSYLWHCLFGGILVFLLRTLQKRTAGLAPGNLRALWLSIAVALGTIVLGIAAFIPFHLYKAAGGSDGTFVLAVLAISGVVFARASKSPVGARDRLIPWISGLFYLFHALAALLFAAGGAHPDIHAKLVPIAFALLAGLAINLGAYHRRATAAVRV